MDGKSGMGQEELVRDVVRSEVGGLFQELRRFVDRRIAELSTEIHATIEMVDLGEAKVAHQLKLMHEQLARIVALPQVTRRNSGVELEAVVQDTEAAANRIMTAAETIQANIASGKGDPEAIAAQVNTIFEACSFQDLTGQRIRRALEELQRVEDMIAEMIGRGVPVPVERGQGDKLRNSAIGGDGPDLAQSDIDKLMAG